MSETDTQTEPEGLAALKSRLRRLVPAIDAVDPASPEGARDHLSENHPFGGDDVREIKRLCDQGLEEGWLAPRAAGPKVRFGRLAKDMGGYAVDTVVMEDGSGLGHTHTKGEINMCWALEGEPRFDGHPPGWVVFPPGSHHVPTVTGGRMLFVYFTPEGAVVWDKA